jgi:MFS family permease
MADEIPDPQELIEAPPTGASSSPPIDPYAAFRLPEFRRYAFGYIVTNLGANMQSVAVGWEIYERTNSAMALGWVGLIQAAPIMLLAMLSGHAADRFDRRRIIFCGQLLMALCSVGLAMNAYFHGPVQWMYLLLLLAAVGRAFFWPASQALLPQIVSDNLFTNAVTWRSTGFQISSVVGPALGGFMIGLQHTTTWVYLLDASMTLVNCICISTISAHPVKQSGESPSLKTLFAGFRYVHQNKLILAGVTLDMFAVLLGGATALLPIYAKDILHAGPTGLGWLRAAPAVGAVCMAVTLSHLPPMQRAGRALLFAVTVFGIATIFFGFSTWLWLSLVMLAITGAADNVSVVIRHNLVQLRTPNEMRGRVSAVNSVFITSSNELGEFESGAVARFFGPVFSVVSGGIGTILVVALVACIWPGIRTLGKLHEERQASP